MNLESLELEKIDYKKVEHLEFLKLLMNSTSIDYLWDISDGNLSVNLNENSFIVLNDSKQKIGYLNISDITEAIYGKTVSIYYAIEENYRGKGYGKKLVKEISHYLFNEKGMDCIVAQVARDNIPSQVILSRNGYRKVFEDEDNTKFLQTKKR